MSSHTLKCTHKIFVSNSAPAGPLNVTCPRCGHQEVVNHRGLLELIETPLEDSITPLTAEEISELQKEAELDKPYKFGGDATSLAFYDQSFDRIGSMHLFHSTVVVDHPRQKFIDLDHKADNLLKANGYVIKKKSGCTPNIPFYRTSRVIKADPPKEIIRKPCRFCNKGSLLQHVFRGFCHKECCNKASRDRNRARRAAKKALIPLKS